MPMRHLRCEKPKLRLTCAKWMRHSNEQLLCSDFHKCDYLLRSTYALRCELYLLLRYCVLRRSYYGSHVRWSYRYSSE